MADVSQIKLPNGSVYDLIDEKSGYITAEYIENKTDYEIPVSRVGEIVVGETAIGTDSTNFPTSKAVVDYVDERVVQEMDAIDVGVISVNGKTGSVTLNASDVGAASTSELSEVWDEIDNISDSDEKLVTAFGLDRTKIYYLVLGEYINTASTKSISPSFSIYETPNTACLEIKKRGLISLHAYNNNYKTTLDIQAPTENRIVTFPDASGTIALTSDIPFVPSWALQSTKPTYTASEVGALPSTTVIPSKTSDLTNDSGYLTASDIASVMTYKGTKANYAALPSTGNITGDVWHLTDTGAEWAWDGSAWQELGTAIDVSSFLTSESDPVFTASPAHGIAASDITNWNGKTAVSIVRW